MKIKYAFLDGTVTEVEVSDEIGAVIIDSRKAEHAQDERHRYHCYSYDAIDYEGEGYGACDEYAVEDDSAEQTARIREAFSHLTATQQRRLRLYANGKTLQEIAAIKSIHHNAVSICEVTQGSFMIYPHRRARFPPLPAAPPQWWFPYLSSPLPGRSRREDW